MDFDCIFSALTRLDLKTYPCKSLKLVIRERQPFQMIPKNMARASMRAPWGREAEEILKARETEVQRRRQAFA